MLNSPWKCDSPKDATSNPGFSTLPLVGRHVPHFGPDACNLWFMLKAHLKPSALHLFSEKITQSGSSSGPKSTWQITMSQARWEQGNKLRHQIVQYPKNVGFGMMQVLSHALPRIRGRCSPGQGSEVSVSGWGPQAISVSTTEVPARWGVTAVESEKLCKRRNKFSNSVKDQVLERELGKEEWKSKANPRIMK